ncbi:MAG: type II secretion system protein M [Phycisphaerae bacterium]|nr:type II secretion system protein M [Phycisphaerae bacterium]
MITKARAYFDSLGDRDRRAILFGIAAIVLILLYGVIGLPLVEDWSRVRDQLGTYESKLDVMGGAAAGSEAKIAGLYQTVPSLELPENEDVQRKLFWDKTYDQLKSAGIAVSSGPSYVASARKKTALGFGTLRLQFSGTCKYEQFVQFLAGLKENPCLFSVEEFSIKSDEKKPEQVNIDMTLETFFK